MIVREFYKTRKDGVNLYKTYSDERYLIRKIGTEEVYSEAIDVENVSFEYEETTEKIEVEETETSETELKAQAYDILVGEVK